VACPSCEQRAHGDSDREHGQRKSEHAFAGPDVVLDHGRQQRQRHEADEPEPRHDLPTGPQAPVGLELIEEGQCGHPWIGRDDEPGRRRAGGRDQAGEQPGNDRQRQHNGDDHVGAVRLRNGNSAGNRSREDGEEGRTLDESVAGGKLARLQFLRQNSVLHGAEQRRDDAEQRQRQEQDRNGMQGEADGGEGGNGNLGELDALGDAGLVEAVRQFAAERRQNEKGGYEDDPR
jgi:hypothetical protein